MKDYYIRFGRKFAIPPTVQIKHEIMRMVLGGLSQPAISPPATIPTAPSLT